MRKLLTLLIAVLLISSSSLWGQVTSITISAQSQWESTGVTITPEMAVTIEATGEWCGAPWSCYGPDGTTGIAPSAFLAPGLPSGGVLTYADIHRPIRTGEWGGLGGVSDGDIWFYGIIFVAPSSRAATPLPHAAVLTAQPQRAIPAASDWGLAAMTLLVLTAGTLILARRRRVSRVAG